jgi:hypothetical protein
MKTLLLIAACLSFTAHALQASPAKTANFVRSDVAAYEGKQTTLDVAYINRINLELDNHPDIALFTAVTFDEKNKTAGGSILVIADVADVAQLTKKFGTNYERSGGNYKTKPMKGTIGRIKNAGKEDILFINLSSMTNPESLPLIRQSVETVSKPQPPTGK